MDYKNQNNEISNTNFVTRRKVILSLNKIEMFHLNTTLNFELLPQLLFQLEVYFKVHRLLTGLTAQQEGTTARWYSNKTSLHMHEEVNTWRHLRIST